MVIREKLTKYEMIWDLNENDTHHLKWLKYDTKLIPQACITLSI